MKNKFPGFEKCMAMMRKRDAVTQEEGFHWLLPHAGEFVNELIAEFVLEPDLGLKCWLLELIGAAKSPVAFDLLVKQLRADHSSLRCWAMRGLKELNTAESRKVLFEARSWAFDSSEKTREFREELDSVPSET